MKTSRARRILHAPMDPLLAVPLFVAILYFGKPVILPIVLAALGAFVLAPLVARVERSGLNRLGSVLVVVVLTGVVAGVATYGVAQQIGGLMRELPEHTHDLQERMKAVRKASIPLSDAVNTIERISGAAREQSQKTVFVEQREGVFSGAFEYVRIAAGPLGTVGLVLVLMIFMLMGREDLRNRLVGLMGHKQLVGSTRILVDSGQRLSRMIAMQLAINSGLGLAFGLALWAIGVPFWFLWGALTTVLRFVPFVGAWIAAVLPFAVSLILTNGWGIPLASLGAFAVLDLLTANAIEPLLIGRRTGVTPIALLIAAVFWSWLWGPVGLLVSTPLTLCLVVLGQHMPRMHFLSMLLGDTPPLSTIDAYYQRLLAGDRVEAEELAQVSAKNDVVDAVDELLLPSLRRAGIDAHLGAITHEDEMKIRELIEKIGVAVIPPRDIPADAPLVLALPARRESEVMALQMLARGSSGFANVQVVSTQTLASEIEERIENEKPALVLIGVVPPRGIAQAEFLCTRLRTKFPKIDILVAHWGQVRDFDKLLGRYRKAGATYVSSTARQTTSQLSTLITHAAKAAPGAPDAAASAG